jgi:rod shape-determining protein MreC
VINGGASSFEGLDDRLSAWWNAGAQNQVLRQQLSHARQQALRAQGLQAENRQLRALLRLTQAEVRPVAVARLLSTSGTSTRRYAILDAGFADGVRPGQPIRSETGLIGRTLEVGPSVARVLLITDQRNVVPGRRASDGLGVLITGRGDHLLDVRTLDSATINLKVGDVLLASGTGGLYQPRTPVARIVRLTRDGALAVPLAQPTATVAVIVEPASDANVDTPPPAAEDSVEHRP